MNDAFRQLRVGDCLRILAVPGQDVPGFYLHDDTRHLFERLIAERAVLCVYRIDEAGMPWVKCPCPGKPQSECVEELGIDGFDVWEFAGQHPGQDAPGDQPGV